MVMVRVEQVYMEIVLQMKILRFDTLDLGTYYHIYHKIFRMITNQITMMIMMIIIISFSYPVNDF